MRWSGDGGRRTWGGSALIPRLRRGPGRLRSGQQARCSRCGPLPRLKMRPNSSRTNWVTRPLGATSHFSPSTSIMRLGMGEYLVMRAGLFHALRRRDFMPQVQRVRRVSGNVPKAVDEGTFLRRPGFLDGVLVRGFDEFEEGTGFLTVPEHPDVEPSLPGQCCLGMHRSNIGVFVPLVDRDPADLQGSGDLTRLCRGNSPTWP